MSEGIISYVLYDPGTRDLLGGYIQVPPPEHVNFVVASESQRRNWPMYRLTPDMSSLELAPLVEMPLPPQPLPAVVSMRQARLALLAAGRLDEVGAAIDSLPSPQKEIARIEWEYASEVERYSEMTLLISGALGMSDDDLDSLFIDAAKYRAYNSEINSPQP